MGTNRLALPSGFVLDDQVSLPDGFVLDSQRHGASGGWQDAPHPAIQGARMAGDALVRGAKGAASMLNPAGIWSAVTNPVETVRNLVDTREQFGEAAAAAARAIPGGRVEPSVMDEQGGSRIKHAADAAGKAIRSIPVIGPMVGGVTDQIIDSAASGDVAGAIGKGIGAAVLARGPAKVGEGMAAKGAVVIPKAERAYAGAFGGGELAESMAPAMMKRGYKPTPGLAAEAEAASAAARVDASALSAARDATRGRRGAAGMRATIEPARDAAVAEAQFQQNLATVAQAIPKSKTLGNVLLDTAKTSTKAGVIGGGLSLATDLVTGGAATLATLAVGATKALLELRKTPMWQASTAMARKSFGEALQRKDLQTAASIGAKIASGAMLADDYGHAPAISALQQEVAQYESPDLRRQAIAAKKGYYVDPNGKRVEIPAAVMSQFTHTPVLTSAQSPVQAWLTAMNKQGNILKGGTLEFTGGFQSPPQTSVDNPPENAEALKQSRGLFAVLPDEMSGVRSAQVGVPYPKAIGEAMGNFSGAYGTGFTDEQQNAKVATGVAPNTIALPPGEVSPRTLYHEAGHSAWFNDLTDIQRAEWDALNKLMLADPGESAQGRAILKHAEAVYKHAENVSNPAERSRLLRQASELEASVHQQIPERILSYPERWREPDETFPEAFMMYVVEPSALLAEAPAVYDWMKRKIFKGKEYIQQGPRRIVE